MQPAKHAFKLAHLRNDDAENNVKNFTPLNGEEEKTQTQCQEDSDLDEGVTA